MCFLCVGYATDRPRTWDVRERKKTISEKLSQPTSTHGLHVRASETGARCDTDVTVTAKARAPPTPLGNNSLFHGIFLSLCLVVQSGSILGF